VTLLHLEGLGRQFGETWALRDLHFTVAEGEIVGLVGPNGAGKTTLFNLISGRMKPTTGRIFFAGQEITGGDPHDICHRGIGRTFQSSRPFARLSTLKNVLVGRVFGKGFRFRGRHEDLEAAREFLDVVGLLHKADTPAGSLTPSEQRRLDLARALATRPRLLLLDEAAAGFSPVAVKQAIGLVRRVQERGVTLFIIDHFLNLSLKVSDRLLALDHGEKVAEGTPPEVMRNREVIRAYFGLRHEEDH
jgi:branched-chain amino acid transport system ATP-binding protein